MIVPDINCIYDSRTAFEAEIYTAAAELESNKAQRMGWCVRRAVNLDTSV